MGLADFAFSLQMRDTIQRLMRESIDTLRPRYRYAKVNSIDRTTRKCTVTFNGETDPVIVNMGSIQPKAVNQFVRIEGIGTDKYISDVIGDAWFDPANLPAAYTTPDTGWINLTPATGYTVIAGEGVSYKVRDSVCYFQFGIAGTTTPQSTLLTMPSGARPPSGKPQWFTGIYGGGVIEVKFQADGTGKVVVASGGNTPGVVVSGSYPTT